MCEKVISVLCFDFGMGSVAQFLSKWFLKMCVKTLEASPWNFLATFLNGSVFCPQLLSFTLLYHFHSKQTFVSPIFWKLNGSKIRKKYTFLNFQFKNWLTNHLNNYSQEAFWHSGHWIESRESWWLNLSKEWVHSFCRIDTSCSHEFPLKFKLMATLKLLTNF